MGLESATFVSDLNSANPAGGDDRSTADDHMRLIKSALQRSFPNAGAPAITTLLTGGGSANTYTVTMSPAATSYATGMFVRFSVPSANTGASTLNVNALGAKSILRTGSALAAGDLPLNAIVEVVYDGTNFQLIGGAGSGASLNTSIFTVGQLIVQSTLSATTGTFSGSLTVSGSTNLAGMSASGAVSGSSLSVTNTATLSGAVVAGKQIVNSSVYSNGSSGSAKTIDWRNGNVQSVTLSANCTFSFTAPSGSGEFVLIMFNSGGYTRSFPSNVYYGGGNIPVWTSGTDVLRLIYNPSAVAYYGTAHLDVRAPGS